MSVPITPPPTSPPFKVGEQLRLLHPNPPLKAGELVRIERVDARYSTGQSGPLTAATASYKLSGYRRTTTRKVNYDITVLKIQHNSLSTTPNGLPSSRLYTVYQQLYLLKDIPWVQGHSRGTLMRGSMVSIAGEGPTSYNGTGAPTKVTGSYYQGNPIYNAVEDVWVALEHSVVHTELYRP